MGGDVKDDVKSMRRRGRPPSRAARRRILRAAHEMLEHGGLLSITMEGVASRARVGKPTVYRQFNNRYELAMAALMEASGEFVPCASGRNPLEELRAQLRSMATLFASGTGRHVALMLASGYGETEMSKAFRSHFVQARREEGRSLLERAIEAGQIRGGISTELVLDLIYGPIFYRLTMGHAPLDAHFADRLLDQVLEGIAGTGN
jgi:AcrR family transcriptional regulator